MLSGCETAPQATRISSVDLPQPVVEKIDPALIKDCEPRYRYPVASMKVQHLKDRLEAAEDALAICRNQLELIRSGQASSSAERP